MEARGAGVWAVSLSVCLSGGRGAPCEERRGRTSGSEPGALAAAASAARGAALRTADGGAAETCVSPVSWWPGGHGKGLTHDNLIGGEEPVVRPAVSVGSPCASPPWGRQSQRQTEPWLCAPGTRGCLMGRRVAPQPAPKGGCWWGWCCTLVAGTLQRHRRLGSGGEKGPAAPALPARSPAAALPRSRSPYRGRAVSDRLPWKRRSAVRVTARSLGGHGSGSRAAGAGVCPAVPDPRLEPQCVGRSWLEAGRSWHVLRYAL